MRTKESVFREKESMHSYINSGNYVEDVVFPSMELFAKEQAIAFGEWLRESPWFPWFPQQNLGKPDCWRYFDHNTEEYQEKSTQELYAQFIESQSTNNKKG